MSQQNPNLKTGPDAVFDDPLEPLGFGGGGGLSSSSAAKLLVDDVILDNILTELDVQDILKLRQVSSQYRRCSDEKVVWTRIIERSEHRLPPLPPTERYSFPNLTSLEAERLLTRAISFPKQWDKQELKSFRTWDIQAYRTILEMVLLPGGQYLVASVTDRSRTRYSVELFTSDFKYSLGFPVARLQTPTKAFDLRAKYMTIHGRPGIVVVYVLRHYRRDRYAERFDINNLSSDWDHPNSSSMVRYECTAVHVPLASLELLGTDTRPDDPGELRTLALKQDRPFQVLTEINSRSRISNIVIDKDVFGAPFIAVLKHPDRIVYKNLQGGLASTMQCTPHPLLDDMPHAIMAFSLLPRQRQFLLVRRAGTDINPATRDPEQDLGPYYFLELYDIVDTPGQTHTRTAASRGAIHDSDGDYWHKVWISDHSLGPSLSLDSSVHLARLPDTPKPITVFVRSELTYGITYEAILPTAEGTYELSEDASFMEHERLPENVMGLNDLYEHRVLPGSTRPIVCSIPRSDSGKYKFAIRALGGIWDERLLGYPPDETSKGTDTGPEQADGGAPAPADGGDVDGADVAADDEEDDSAKVARPRLDLEPEDMVDVSAMAWDETIGRLCIGYATDTRIAVFDYAGAPLRPRCV